MKKSHGMSRTRLYTIWKNMKQRCYNPKRNSYQWYGGKGIRVCEEWQTFTPFMEWALSHGYTDGLVLDRVDSNKNYEPSNCRWVTPKENSIKAVYERTGEPVFGNATITYKGKTQTLREWATELGMRYGTLYNRIKVHHLSIDEAFTKPVKKHVVHKKYKARK